MGLLPMASATVFHNAEQVAAGIFRASAAQEENDLPEAYHYYIDVDTHPAFTASSDLAWEITLWPMVAMSAVVKNFMLDASYWAANVVVIVGSGSKGAASLAYLIHSRPGTRLWGVTASPEHVTDLGLYDAVYTYEQAYELEQSPADRVLLVDFSGHPVVEYLHDLWDAHMVRSLKLGHTHNARTFPRPTRGPPQEFFWNHHRLNLGLGVINSLDFVYEFRRFVEFAKKHYAVVRATGFADILKVVRRVFHNRLDPACLPLLSLKENRTRPVQRRGVLQPAAVPPVVYVTGISVCLPGCDATDTWLQVTGGRVPPYASWAAKGVEMVEWATEQGQLGLLRLEELDALRVTTAIACFVAVEATRNAGYSDTRDLRERNNAVFWAGQGINYYRARASVLMQLLGWSGRAQDVSTACTSGLVAVHEAAAALRSRHVANALLVSVSDEAESRREYLTTNRLLASSGLQRPYCQGRDGMMPANGAVGLLLETRAFGKNPVKVVGSAWTLATSGNFGGLSAGTQAPIVRNALIEAGMEPHDVDFVELRGGGTEVGDALEVETLEAVFSGRVRPLSLGTYTFGLGDLDLSGGLISIARATLALRQRTTVPSAFPYLLDPELPFPTFRGTFGKASENDLPETKTTVGAVHSYGMDGSIAHVIFSL